MKEVIAFMEHAKLFANGQSQAVRLPKEYRFPGDEVGIKKLGDIVMLVPKHLKEDIFFSSLGEFSDDVFESIELARKENQSDSVREIL